MVCNNTMLITWIRTFSPVSLLLLVFCHFKEDAAAIAVHRASCQLKIVSADVCKVFFTGLQSKRARKSLIAFINALSSLKVKFSFADLSLLFTHIIFHLDYDIIPYPDFWNINVPIKTKSLWMLHITENLHFFLFSFYFTFLRWYEHWKFL